MQHVENTFFAIAGAGQLFVNSDTWSYQPGPLLDVVTPPTGSPNGGTQLTLTGT